MTTRKGYVVAAAVFLLGVAVGGIFMWRLYARIDAMPRIEMPGEGTVTLPAGALVVFAEQAPGTVGELSISARCEAFDAGGAPIALSPPGSPTSYAFGSHRGQNMFELRVPARGDVRVTCESDDRFILAFGHGIGGGIVLIVVSMVTGGLVATFIGFRTWRRRRRERRAAAIATAAG